MIKQNLITLLLSISLIIFLFLCTSAHTESKVKPIELKVATWNSPQLAPSKLAEKWGKMVEERSGGKVKLVFYFSGSLVTMNDTYRAMQTGLVDIGMWVIGTIPGLHPLNEYISLPFMGWNDSKTALKVYHEIRDKFPELDAEFKGLKNIYTYAMPPYHIHTTKKTIRLPDDMGGMKILADATSSDFLHTLDAVAVSKGPADWFMSLQRGLVDGQLLHWAAVDGFNLEELFTTHTQPGPAGLWFVFSGWWMNMDSWNRLPPEAQKAFIDLQPWVEEEHLKLSLELEKKAQADADETGHKIINLTPEEIDLWVKETEPVREKWIADMEKKGKPGRAIYEEAQRLISLYNQ
ncbi:TRAP transporter substrate-binding protein DctP [Deltaproteobacteria bacterium]|nr:TRAP transporter substrate-binding protein DctP [Deltaproteobacteria bacterium]